MDTQTILALREHASNDSLRGFLSLHGYSLMDRSSGEAGLDLLRQRHIQLVILETQLDDGSGFDWCRELRQQGYHQPVLMLVGQDIEIDRVLALEMGADDCMTTPYSQRELLSRIRALLRRAYGEFAHPFGEQLCIGALVIDRLRGQVWNAGSLITLTPIEFRLLTHFAQHPNQVLSRAQIIDAVWGCEVDVNSERVVNTHICRLRGKVESRALVIRTVNGLGYCLEQRAIEIAQEEVYGIVNRP